jgi:hypothetical protein
MRREKRREAGWLHALVADDGVELEDGVVLLGGEGPALDVGAEVVCPPEPAALAAPVQPCMRAGGVAGLIISPDRSLRNNQIDEEHATYVPASLGSMRQLPGPLAWTKSTSSLSSSGAHGPFLIPLLSQHGVLPMASVPPRWRRQLATTTGARSEGRRKEDEVEPWP